MKFSTIKSSQVSKSIRFDGSYHLSEGVQYSDKIHRMKFEYLGDLASSIFTAGRTKRVYTSKEYGFPYLSNSDVSKSNPFESCNYNSKKHGFDAKSVLKEGMIVTGRVGAIGQTSYITSEFEILNAMGSDNIIRIVSKDEKKSGYLYSYLASKYGITFFNKLSSGGVQPYISEEMIEEIPVPLLEESKQRKIHDLIAESSNFKVEANNLLNNAISFFEDYLNKHSAIKGVQFDTISSKKILEFHKRFDSQYQVLWNNIKKEYIDVQYTKVSELAANIFVGGRGKRIYVEKGLPFLSSSDMMLFNPVRLCKKVSTNTPGINQMKVNKYDILISRSGTVGNTVLVGDNLKQVAVSEHALRLIIDKNKISPNYVFAYLKTKIGIKKMEASSFGSVIITLNEDLIANIDIPILSIEIQSYISEKIDQYLMKMDLATLKENQAIDLIEKEIDAWQ